MRDCRSVRKAAERRGGRARAVRPEFRRLLRQRVGLSAGTGVRAVLEDAGQAVARLPHPGEQNSGYVCTHLEVALFRLRPCSSVRQANVLYRSSRNGNEHNEKHQAVRVPYASLTQYLFFHKSSERPLPLRAIDFDSADRGPRRPWRAAMPSPLWEPATGTNKSGARKESTDRVAGASETLSRWRFARLRF